MKSIVYASKRRLLEDLKAKITGAFRRYCKCFYCKLPNLITLSTTDVPCEKLKKYNKNFFFFPIILTFFYFTNTNKVIHFLKCTRTLWTPYIISYTWPSPDTLIILIHAAGGHFYVTMMVYSFRKKYKYY